MAAVRHVLSPSMTAVTRCAASCSQVLRTIAARKMQPADTTRSRCHKTPAQTGATTHEGDQIRGFAQQEFATSQVANVHESPPSSDESAYNKMNAKNVSSKGELPSARTKHTAARSDPWPLAAVAICSGSKQPPDNTRGEKADCNAAVLTEIVNRRTGADTH